MYAGFPSPTSIRNSVSFSKVCRFVVNVIWSAADDDEEEDKVVDIFRYEEEEEEMEEDTTTEGVQMVQKRLPKSAQYG